MSTHSSILTSLLPMARQQNQDGTKQDQPPANDNTTSGLFQYHHQSASLLPLPVSDAPLTGSRPTSQPSVPLAWPYTLPLPQFLYIAKIRQLPSRLFVFPAGQSIGVVEHSPLFSAPSVPRNSAPGCCRSSVRWGEGKEFSRAF